MRRSFQARVQRLLAVRWFTERPGIKTSQLSRKSYCPTARPCQEEEAVLGGVLTSPYLMQKTTELLQHFQHELTGMHGFFDELGVMPTKVSESRFGGEVEPMSAQRKKDIVMRLAVKAIHQSKWTALRICWSRYIQKQDKELKWLRQSYDELQQQFLTVRQDYLQELSMLRDQTRVRGDMDTSDWQIQGRGSDVVYFFDPAKALTPRETEFMLMAVKEKLTMILESNPRVAGCIDLGQFEKLKELRESQEVQNMRQVLVRKGHEVNELRQTVAQLQEELLAVPKTASTPAAHVHVMADLEEKVADLRSSAQQLKQEMRLEAKERRLAEGLLEAARLECSELQAAVEQMEADQSSLQSALSTSKRDLEEAEEHVQQLLGKERDLQVRLTNLNETCESLKKAVRRARIAESRKQPTSPKSPASYKTKSIAFMEEPFTPELVPEPASVDSPSKSSADVDISLLDEAHEQLLEAWAKRDAEMAKVEELTQQNAQLRRQLAKQSQGLLLMDADNSAGEARHLASFVETVRAQLLTDADGEMGMGASEFQVSFPELEAELKVVSAEASQTLAAVRSALEQLQVGNAAPAELEALQELQQKSLSCQSQKRDLEKKLLELSTKSLNGVLESETGPGEDSSAATAATATRHMRGVTVAAVQLLTEVGQKMQELATENAELRGALLSLSARLTQATSLIQASPALSGDGTLQKCLTTMTKINEDHVPAVFDRLFNGPRRPSMRLERQAQDRKSELMKSSCIHLADELPRRPTIQSIPGAIGAEEPVISPRDESGRASRGVHKMLRRNSSLEADKDASCLSPEARFGLGQSAPSDDERRKSGAPGPGPPQRQRRESLRMSSFEFGRPSLDKTTEKEQLFPMSVCAISSEARLVCRASTGPMSPDSPEAAQAVDLSSTSRPQLWGKQRSLADKEAADSAERQRFSKTNYRRDYKQHRLAGGGIDIKGDVDKAFDKAMEKLTPRQPRPQLPFWKDEGPLLPHMPKVSVQSSPRGPISPGSRDDGDEGLGPLAPLERALSVGSSLSSGGESDSMLHAATCPAQESAPQKWQSDHLPAVPMVSIQQLELRQESHSSWNEPLSSRRQMSKTDATPYSPVAPKESWRSSMQYAITRRRNSDISSMVNRPDPPQMRRRSFLGL
ncbi:mshA [Symbiodinium sp. CCMP2592]|nr:mshA [Symbiodinium sp. CCMP2592]